MGLASGLVKLYDLSDVLNQNNANLVERESAINAFTHYGRTANISRLKFHPTAGALFAASNIGVVKLLRLSV